MGLGACSMGEGGGVSFLNTFCYHVDPPISWIGN